MRADSVKRTFQGRHKFICIFSLFCGAALKRGVMSGMTSSRNIISFMGVFPPTLYIQAGPLSPAPLPPPS